MEAQHYHLIKGNAFLRAIAASLSLAIGMGFGRFAFTGLYPLMIEDGIISIQSGSHAASANYAGYFAGALLATWIKTEQARRYCFWSVIMTIACMASLALVDNSWIVIGIRGLAGVFSAITMVGASLWLLQHIGQTHHAPLLFAGVGAGIAVSAELIAFGSYLELSSGPIWLLLALVSFVLFLPFSSALADGSTHAHRHSNAQPVSAPTSNPTNSAFYVALLVVIYGISGTGYIITATYLPLLIQDFLETTNPIHVWAAFGLGAAPSCYLWHALHLRFGTRNSLTLNLVLQSLGVALPAVSPTLFSSLASAVIVGGTFMGAVTIAMSAARDIEHTVRLNLLALMTAAYGIGQIIGPLIANEIYSNNESFTGALITASMALLVASILSLFYRSLPRCKT